MRKKENPSQKASKGAMSAKHQSRSAAFKQEEASPKHVE